MYIRERINSDIEVGISFNGREFDSYVQIGDNFTIGFGISENGTIKHNLKSATLFDIYASAISSTSFASKVILPLTYSKRIEVNTSAFNALVNRTFFIDEDIAIEE